jgi:MerR family transcriptional regulator, heat shock protein HspR
MAGRRGDSDHAIYIISVAAELAGVHPQTLRVYERKGLLRPERTEGNTRRYSQRDVDLLRRIQELTADGINLAGVTRILQLEQEISRLKARNARVAKELEVVQEELRSIGESRDSTALVPFKEIKRIRRAMKSDALDAASRPRAWPAPPIRP